MTSLAQFPLFAIKNKSLIDLSNKIGCFHCLKMVDKDQIKDFTDNGQTAICPLCSVDSLVGDACGVAINNETLLQANNFWYKKTNK